MESRKLFVYCLDSIRPSSRTVLLLLPLRLFDILVGCPRKNRKKKNTEQEKAKSHLLFKRTIFLPCRPERKKEGKVGSFFDRNDTKDERKREAGEERL
jgi:hypothetical protein